MNVFLRTVIALAYLVSAVTAQAGFVVNSYNFGVPGFDANTIVLIHADGTDASTTFVDSANTPHTITATGNAQVDTAQFQFGTASALFDGSGDYLSMADTADLRPGSGDYTYEGWVRFDLGSDFQTLFGKGYTSAGDLLIQTSNAATPVMLVYASGSVIITASSSTSLDTWHHWALVRSGTTVTLYQDGTSVGTATSSVNHNTTTALTVGGSSGGGGAASVLGWIDEFRYSNTARYTGSFTPSASPFDP